MTLVMSIRDFQRAVYNYSSRSTESVFPMPPTRPRSSSSALFLFHPSLTPPRLPLPLFAYPVRAGFPSPAEDYVSEHLDLNEHLIANKEATFYLRAKGNSMIGAGIQDGDLLVVDRSVMPTHRSVVIAVLDGEFTCKRLYRRAGRIRLIAENPDFPPIDLNDGQQLQVWGVVTSVIHRLSP